MIKSIVLLATLLAVVVAHPQGLGGMAVDDPLLLELTAQAFKLYSSEPKNEELVRFFNARSTHLKERVRFELEVKGQECEECSCSEYTKIVHVNCDLQHVGGYLFTFTEEPLKYGKKFNKC